MRVILQFEKINVPDPEDYTPQIMEVALKLTENATYYASLRGMQNEDGMWFLASTISLTL